MAEEKGRSLRRPDPFEEIEVFPGWSPFRELASPSRASRWWSDVFGAAARRGELAPAVDLSEANEKYVITCELPGVNRDDVTVEMHENVLTIRGEKKSEREEKKERSRWVERTYGSFSRSFTLPSNALGDRVSASFSDGVLTIEVPKVEEQKPKTISIRS